MNTTALGEQKENSAEKKVINLPDEEKKKSGKDHSLLIMTSISLFIMLIAVGLIYYYVNINPGISRENDQTVAVSENNGFVNPDSIQKLENDTSNFTMKPADNSDIYVIFGGIFMVVMVGAFVFVKVVESKEDN